MTQTPLRAPLQAPLRAPDRLTVVLDGLSVMGRRGTRRRTPRPVAFLRARGPGRWATVVITLAVASVVAVLHSRGMYTAPIRFDDEGTYVSQARSLLDDGLLAPYTYWYDHPPLGWMLLAGWLGGPALLLDAPNVIGSGRQFMLVTDVLSVVLMVVLARRLGLSRLAAGGAALLFGLSPLALNYHRMVLLDNIATPLLLGAMVLALSPGKRLTAAFGSGLAFASAVLVKETLLLLVPFVAWLMWRNASHHTRRMSLMVAGIGFAMVTVMYPLFAVVKGELLPGADHVSLWDALVFQLVGRTSSGNVLDPASDAHSIVSGWLALDPYLLGAATLLCIPALFLARIRPVAAALLFLLLMMMRPGYLPVPYVVALVPLAALVVAGSADAFVRLVPTARWREGRLRPVDAVAIVLVALVSAVVVSAAHARVQPDWYYRNQALMQNDFDQPYRESTRWLTSEIPRGSTLLVDNVTRTDLLAAGFSPADVVWFTKLDVDPDVVERYPDVGSFDYVVSTDIMRTSRQSGPTLRAALDGSRAVARFGAGARTIVVREVR